MLQHPPVLKPIGGQRIGRLSGPPGRSGSPRAIQRVESCACLREEPVDSPRRQLRAPMDSSYHSPALRLRYEMTADNKARFLDAYPDLLDEVQEIDKGSWSPQRPPVPHQFGRFLLSEQFTLPYFMQAPPGAGGIFSTGGLVSQKFDGNTFTSGRNAFPSFARSFRLAGVSKIYRSSEPLSSKIVLNPEGRQILFVITLVASPLSSATTHMPVAVGVAGLMRNQRDLSVSESM
jgi:hypothetical protein